MAIKLPKIILNSANHKSRIKWNSKTIRQSKYNLDKTSNNNYIILIVKLPAIWRINLHNTNKIYWIFMNHDKVTMNYLEISSVNINFITHGNWIAINQDKNSIHVSFNNKSESSKRACCMLNFSLTDKLEITQIVQTTLILFRDMFDLY